VPEPGGEIVSTLGGQPSGLLRAYWALNLYPQAAEAGGCLVRPGPRVVSGGGSDAERSEAEAVRRARAKLRRYVVANRLNRLGTLTYAGDGCFDPVQLRSDVGAFFKELRPGLGGERFPYLWTSEWHPGGHGLHVHFGVGRYVRWTLIRDSWGRGRVHIKLLGDLPVGSGALAEARLNAWYLGKYVAKGLDDERRTAGLHRYEVAQGFQPEQLLVYGRTDEEAIGQASEYLGRAPEYVWRSENSEGWHGPPACWVAWPE
jgi:hypothetical protein